MLAEDGQMGRHELQFALLGLKLGGGSGVAAARLDWQRNIIPFTSTISMSKKASLIAKGDGASSVVAACCTAADVSDLIAISGSSAAA